MKSHAIFTCSLARNIILALLALFCLCTCNDDAAYYGSPFACSMNMDGSNFRFESLNAMPLFENPSSSLYYLSDDLIIYSDLTSIYKKELNSTAISIARRANYFLDNSLEINAEAEKVFFIDIDGIYECDFSGENRQQLSTGSDGNYKFLSLSEDKKYLVSTKQQNIIRIDLETGENLSIEAPHPLSKTWYNSALDRYFGYFTDPLTIFWMKNGIFYDLQQDPPVFSLSEYMQHNPSDHSSDLRYFGIRQKYSSRLLIYDLLQNTFENIGFHVQFAFLPGEHRFLASGSIHHMCDIRLYDAENLSAEEEMQYELLFDGIFANKSFLNVTDHIYPRWDGEKFFLHGRQKSERVINTHTG